MNTSHSAVLVSTSKSETIPKTQLRQASLLESISACNRMQLSAWLNLNRQKDQEKPSSATLAELDMINDDVLRQKVYQHILKTAHKRLEQAIPGSTEGAFADLSLAALLNLLFLLKGEWSTLGDYVTTQKALRAVIGDDLLWAEPQKATPASPELVN
jgi:hypothetical protein